MENTFKITLLTKSGEFPANFSPNGTCKYHYKGLWIRCQTSVLLLLVTNGEALGQSPNGAHAGSQKGPIKPEIVQVVIAQSASGKRDLVSDHGKLSFVCLGQPSSILRQSIQHSVIFAFSGLPCLTRPPPPILSAVYYPSSVLF